MNVVPIHPQESKRQTRSCSGFTLVEVVLSLGILSFGMVSMMSLLSVGCQALGDSIKQTAGVQIVRNMGALTAQADFSSLGTDLTEEIHYFDSDGMPVSEEKAIFRAGFVPAEEVGQIEPVQNPKLRVITFWVENLTERNSSGSPSREYHSIYAVNAGR